MAQMLTKDEWNQTMSASYPNGRMAYIYERNSTGLDRVSISTQLIERRDRENLDI